MNALLRLASLTLLLLVCSSVVAHATPCASCGPIPGSVPVAYDADAAGPSWIFKHSTYSHDPMTGARVAQYMRTPPVEPLEDQRNVTSRYRRSRTNLRGADGSFDTYYEVQAWGNGRGGIDAEWERFHDAWKESYLQNGFYNQRPSYGHHPGWGNNWYGPGYGGPGWGGGFPGNGYPGNFPPHGGGGWNGGGGHRGGANGGP